LRTGESTRSKAAHSEGNGAATPWIYTKRGREGQSCRLSVVEERAENLTASGGKAAMTRKDYDAFCGGLPHATHVVQWGDASVWKIGGKVFAIGGWSHGDEFAVSFKCSKTSFAILSELPGLRPAPYLASRGLLWMQRVDMRSFSDHDLKQYLRQSYAMILAALPKKTQEALRARI
jgi:predicted DNA-binding protein (MmcQ/YjbR family)